MDQEINLTRNGIAYDLGKSPYKRLILYSPGRCVAFYFSSSLYLTKFDAKLKENREEINGSLSKRFGFDIKNDLLCDIKLYSRIEKRGFLIGYRKERYTCLDSITLDGQRLIIKN